MDRLKNIIKQGLKNLFHWYKIAVTAVVYYGGIYKLSLLIKSIFHLGRPKILCFHNISNGSELKNKLGINIPPEIFHETLAFICRHYQVVTLDEAVELLKRRARLRKDVIAISFDDYYKGWYRFVLPICRENRIPFAVFVVTEPLDTRHMLFYDAIMQILEKTTKATADLSAYGFRPFSLSESCQVVHFMKTVSTMFRDKPLKEQREFISTIENYFGVFINELQDESHILSWEQVIEMDRDGVTIGAHSASHPNMETLSHDECREEALVSRIRLENILGHPVYHFAYPYGNSSIEKQCIRDAGFRYAFTLSNVTIKEFDPFMIPRTTVTHGMLCGNNKFNESLLAIELSGLGEILFIKRFRAFIGIE